MVWYNTLICLIFLLFYSREMCLRFADLERKLGEIDRARAVYMHASQMADPRVCSYLLRFSRASFPLKELETNLNKSDSPRSSPHLNCHAMRVQAYVSSPSRFFEQIGQIDPNEGRFSLQYSRESYCFSLIFRPLQHSGKNGMTLKFGMETRIHSEKCYASREACRLSLTHRWESSLLNQGSLNGLWNFCPYQNISQSITIFYFLPLCRIC